MDFDRTRWLAVYGISAGASLIGWWAAYGIGAVPAPFVPLDVRAGHIAAEVALGVALIAGGVLTGRRHATARPVLIASLGGLCYATLNVVGDYLARWPARSAMSVLLVSAALSAIVALVLAVRREN